MLSIFTFEDYKAYLRAIEEQRTIVQRGFRSRLAEVLECQSAYISQILNSSANFSLEQGLRISKFLQHEEMEERYFLLLIEFARAGSADLRTYFAKDLERLKESQLSLEKRLQAEQALDPKTKSVYYSSWLYPTIHILVTIPEYRTIERIVTALRLPPVVVKEAVLFLVRAGLLTEKKGLLQSGPTKLHLEKGSPFIRQYHTNWRVASIESLARAHERDVHYSTVSSLSLKDAALLRAEMFEMIDRYVNTVGASKEEMLFNFNLDFYRLLPD